jgi:hypothetical protein
VGILGGVRWITGVVVVGTMALKCRRREGGGFGEVERERDPWVGARVARGFGLSGGAWIRFCLTTA